MADPLTDWETCGQRRSRAQRIVEIVAEREQQHLDALNHRRDRLRALLEGEEARLQEELRHRISVLQERQNAARMEATVALRAKQEEDRLRQVRLADEQREREQSHEYREQYWREVQRYLNQTRPLDIALRDHIRTNYGVHGSKRH